jgi:hypothetical protein
MLRRDAWRSDSPVDTARITGATARALIELVAHEPSSPAVPAQLAVDAAARLTDLRVDLATIARAQLTAHALQRWVAQLSR